MKYLATPYLLDWLLTWFWYEHFEGRVSNDNDGFFQAHTRA